MSQDPECIFCRIVAGDIPSTKLYEDDATLAFMDINPVNPGHCLVIPKAHADDIFEIGDDDIAAAARTARRIAGAVHRALTPGGINLLQANGVGAGQTVFHLHFHVMPRRPGDAVPLNWTQKPGDLAEIAAVAEKIRAELKQATRSPSG